MAADTAIVAIEGEGNCTKLLNGTSFNDLEVSDFKVTVLFNVK